MDETSIANEADGGIHDTRRGLLGAVGLVAGASTLAVPAKAQVANAGPLRSAGILAFGPDNVLFVGDNNDGSVHAFELRPSDLTSQAGVELGNWHNFEGRDLVPSIDEKAAELLGTTRDQIVINDMVVHPRTQQVFISVERGRGPRPIPVIFRVHAGRLEALNLTGVRHSKISLTRLPETQRLEFGQLQRSLAITDIKYFRGELFVAGLSNERFASTLRRIRFPFDARIATSSTEIWHSVHGQFETRAPIVRGVIHEVNGQPFYYAVYACTPLVRFPLSALTDGAHVRGDTIGELGYGNNPLDMLIFKDPMDSHEYLLVTHDLRSASRVALVDLAQAPAMPVNGPKNFGPDGVKQFPMPIRTEHIALLNERWAVALYRHATSPNRLDLHSFALPFLFTREDGIVEMNFPGGPDPFEYHTPAAQQFAYPTAPSL